MSFEKSGFTLAGADLPHLKCTSTVLSICGEVGGTTYDKAALIAHLVAAGVVSPNGLAAPEVLGVKIGVIGKGQDAFDLIAGAAAVANGADVTATEKGNQTILNALESEFYGEHLEDADCDGVPDAVLAADWSLDVPEASCVKIAVQVV